MANRIQLRRDGAQQWANVNPILAQGEIGIEIDTSRIKIGDGVTPWNSLKYERPIETESNTANTLVKRDADGNFAAGAITASLIGNSATATRLANTRSFTLAGDMSGSASFDGSANVNITAELNYVTSLPHYDSNNLSATGTYTQLTIDSRGRIINANNPTSLSTFGITDAQPLDADLTSLANMTTFGLISRESAGTLVNRQITGGAGRIIISNGDGQASNPLVDLADTAVVVGQYNPNGNLDPSLISIAGNGNETVNTTQITLDRYGRSTQALTIPIATAKEGSTYAAFDNATAYDRFAIVETSGARVYQAAIRDIGAGLGEPSHTDTSDTGGWRYLWTAQIEQKGLASFAQEDFDVTVWDGTNNTIGGHVSISENAIENSQLQSNGLLMFTDTAATETYVLDKERNVYNAYHGLTKINHLNINNRTGGSAFRVVGYDTGEYPYQPSILSQGNSYSAPAADAANGNGSATSGSSLTGAVDINLDTTLSGNLTLDVSKVDQFIKRTSGNVEFALEVNENDNRTLAINATNAGAGDAIINITSDQDITISATDVDHRVNVEDYHFQDNVLSTTNSTMVLDPNDDDDITGLVQIRGDLQVDGTTTTVNSTVTTVDDPIMTLGGDTAPLSSDSKDRGIEFRYYQASSARIGFFGWDSDYANTNIWSGTGGYRFVVDGTNTNEVFSGTDAPIIAGNLALTTNTGSTSTTTGTLVVTGGFGLSENANIGGTTTIAGQTEVNNNVLFKADNKSFNIQTAGGVDKFTVDYDNGNTVIEGTVDIQLETTITDNLIVQADNKKFDIQTAAGASVFDVDTDNGNTHTDGTLDVDGGVTLNSTLDVDGGTTLNSTLDVDDDVTIHNDFLLDTTGKTFTITNGSTQTFQITSTNGNTDIEGTVNVGGVNTFELTTDLTVDASTSESDITVSNIGALDVKGGANIDKDVRVGKDLYVADRIIVKDAGTARTAPSLLNNVDIKYRQYIGSSTAHNATFADDADANLRVAGGAGIVQDLHIGDDLYIGKATTNENVEFQVLGESGATTIGRVGQGTATDGSLTVHGDATFNREVNITGSQTTIGDADTDALTVNATSTFNGDVTLAAGKNLEVGGNTVVEGNLTVNGTTTTINSTTQTLDDPVFTLGGDTAPSQADAKDRGIEFRYYDGSAKIGFFGWDNTASRFALWHNATNSSEAFSGTRTGIDAGSLKLFDTTAATNNSTGALIVGGGASVGLDLYVGDDLVVTDDGSFGGDVDITGTLDVTSDFAINSTKFTVASATGNTVVQGTLQVDGNATIGNASGDAHIVTGTVQFNQAITSTDITADNIKIGVDAANEISTTTGNLVLDSDGGTVNVTDDLDVDNNLNVDGNAKVDGTLTVDGNTTIGNASGDAHSVTGTVQFNQAITSTDITADDITIGVAASNEISTTAGNLVLDSNAGKVHITDNAEVDGNLQVDGNSTLGDSDADTLTVNATSTFNAAITSGDITADNIQLGVSGTSEIDTSAGNLTLDSATGETIVDDNFTVNGTTDIDGLTTITDGVVVKADNKTFEVQTAGGTTKFTVDTDNGNTDVKGTLDVAGVTTLANNLGVQGSVDFDTTLNVDGGATFQDDVTINADNKEFKIQNNSNVTKFSVDTDNGNTVVEGTVNVKSAVDFDTTLNVDGNTTITSNTNPTGLAANAALMISAGGGTVAEDFYIGDSLFLGPNAATTITLNGTTGNVDIGGTLDVTGNTTLAVLEASSLTTTASINVGGSLLINSTKFQVVGASGNTTIEGTLNVDGASVIDDTLNVTGAVDFDSTLNVDGNSTFSGTITQNSTSLFKDDFVLRGASKTLKLQNGSGTDKVVLNSTSGAATFGGLTTTNTLDVTSNTTIGGTLGVTGQITGDVTGDLTGNADTSTLVNITNTPTSNLTYYPTFVSANTGNTEIRTDSSNLTYNPSTNTLTVNNFKSTTDFEVQGNLNVTGALTFFQSQVGSIANHDTDALTEGSTNLYFTNERVDDRVNNLINAGTGISATYDDAGNMLTLSAVQSDLNTDNFTEGSTNLFTTAARTRTHFTYGTGIELSAGGELSVTQGDIDTDNVTEGSTNLFTTAARTRGHISVSGDLGYNASTGVISYTIPTTIASLNNHDTDDLAEGNNLYYTDERVDDRINALIIAGTGVEKVYDDGANTYTLSVTQADINSDNVTEGSTNLFTTAARTRGHISVSGSLAYNSGTGVISYTTPDTDGISEGSSNLYYTDARADARITNAGISGGVFTGDVTGDLTGNADTCTTATRVQIWANNSTDATHYITFVDAATGSETVDSDTGLTYNPSSGIITATQFTGAVVGNVTGTVSDVSNHDTDDITEGSSNLYYTDARARGAVSAGGDLSYNSGTGVFSITKSSKADLDVDHLITLTGVSAASDNLGTFTGTTIADNETTKGALQDLETAVETKLASSAVSAYGATLVDDADAAAARTTLGLGSAATTASTAYATAAQGTQATTNDSDIDDLYTELNAIGNDASVTTVAQLKAALAALSR